MRSWWGGTAIAFMLWFGLGMALAVVSVGLAGRERQPRLIRLVTSHPLLPWLVAVGGYVALSAWLPPTPYLTDRGQVTLAHVCFGVIATLLLLPAVFGDRAGGAPRRFLANPIIAWLGLVSYGIFLWHYAAALQFGLRGAGDGFGVVLLGTLAVSIPCAAASYYLLERRVLRLKYRRLRDLIRGGGLDAAPESGRT